MNYSPPHHEIYLNNAATSWPKPDSVIKAISDNLLSLPGESGRSTDELTRDPIQEARETVAGFFQCKDPDHLIFTSGATQSLNMLIHGFTAAQSKPFHVITTDLDHNSVLRPLTTLADQNLIELSIIPSLKGYIQAEDVKDAIRDDTRMMVITQGSNVLGTVQKIPDIHNALKNDDIFLLVDGSQTAGQIPINLDTLGADAYVFTGHKYLFGMSGTGGFYIQNPEAVKPVMQGGTGTNSENLRQPGQLPDRFESGTPNYPGIISLQAGVSYLSKMGFDQISAHQKACTNAFFEPLKNVEDIIFYNQVPDIPVFPVNIRGLDADTAGFVLRTAYGIITRTGLHCAPLIHMATTNGKGCIRLSPSVLTDPEDCRYAGEMLANLAKNVRDGTR